MHARAVTLGHEHHADFARINPYGRCVQKALCYEAPHKLANGSVTIELLVLRPIALSWISARRPVHGKSSGSGRVTSRAGELPQKPSVNSPLPATARGGCSSVPRTKPWERLVSARATMLAAHKASGSAAHTFDASRSEEFNTVASDGKFWAAQVRYPAWDFLAGCAKRLLPLVSESAESRFPHTDDSGPLTADREREAAHPQKLKGRHLSHRGQVHKICRESSCSHDECRDPCPRQLSHVCTRCLQFHRLASFPVQQKRRDDRATKDESNWKLHCGGGTRMPHAWSSRTSLSLSKSASTEA